jgi:hypothetical protein
MASEKDFWNVAAAIGTVASAVFAAIAAWQTKKAALQAQRAAERTESTARAGQLSDLWSEVQTLTYLTDEELAKLDQDVAKKIRHNVNTMEKIAFSWKVDLVDRRILENEIGKSFVKLYQQIENLPEIPELKRSGTELLAQNPLVTEFYNYVNERSPNAGSPSSAVKELQSSCD